MPWPVQIAPVAIVELKAVSRRWQTFGMRAGLVLLLGATLGLVCLSYQSGVLLVGGRLSHREYAEVGTNFATAVLVVQLALVLFAAPATAAGAVCIDKSRGNAALLMATHMSAADFVLGKVIGRLSPMIALIMASVPLLFITAFLGGINYEFLIGGFIVLVGAATLGCSFAILMSLYVKRTHEALMLCLVAGTVWLMLYPVSLALPVMPALAWMTRGLWVTNPVKLLIAPLDPKWGVGWQDYALYLGFTLGLSAMVLLIAVRQFRRVVLRHGHRPIRFQRGWRYNRRWASRMLDRNPLRWYERYRRQPTWAGRCARSLIVMLAVTATAIAILLPIFMPGYDYLPSHVCAAITGIVLGIASVNAVSALADEKSRGSLEILTTTPLTTVAIFRAKWWAAIAAVPMWMLLPLIINVATWWQTYVNVKRARWAPPPNPESVWCLLFSVLLPLTCAAMLSSIGLFLALQMKNYLRAVGTVVAIYVLVSISWPVSLRVLGISAFDYINLNLFSPLCAASEFNSQITTWPHQPSIAFSSLVICAVNLSAAIYFFVLSRIIADRKMGRISRPCPTPITLNGAPMAAPAPSTRW